MTCKNSINWQGADIQGVIRVFDMGATVFFQNGLRDELVTREDAWPTKRPGASRSASNSTIQITVCQTRHSRI